MRETHWRPRLLTLHAGASLWYVAWPGALWAPSRSEPVGSGEGGAGDKETQGRGCGLRESLGKSQVPGQVSMTTAAQFLPHPTCQDTSRTKRAPRPAREAGHGVYRGNLFPVGRRVHSESKTEKITSPQLPGAGTGSQRKSDAFPRGPVLIGVPLGLSAGGTRVFRVQPL